MAKKTGRAKVSSTRDFIKPLISKIATSFLPGEARLDGDELDEAANFLLQTALVREERKPAIVIASHPASPRIMRIGVINKDMPFLVDSIAAALSANGLPIDLLLHPILPVRRKNSQLIAVPEGEGIGEKQESWVYIESSRIDAKGRRGLEKDLQIAIADVRAAVTDWPKMRDHMVRDADQLSDGEGAALLRWLSDGMLTQLGHITHLRDGSHKDALGICRSSTPDPLAAQAYKAAFAWFDGTLSANNVPGRAPLIIKANRLSKVHRRVPLDLFILPIYENGKIAALSIHIGLWTSAALVTPPDNVPVLRQQLQTVMEQLEFTPDSHDYKALIHALTTLPHDLAVSFDDKEIVKVVGSMMALADRPRPRAILVPAPLDRHIFGFVWLPRDMLSTSMRIEIEDMLEAQTGARTLNWSLSVEGGELALLRYVMDWRDAVNETVGAKETSAGPRIIDDIAIDQALHNLTRGWVEAVEDALVKEQGGAEKDRATALALRFADSFPQNYRNYYDAQEAAKDIDRLRHLLAGESSKSEAVRDVRLYCQDAGCGEQQLRLKIYQNAGQLPLSDAVPAFENFGFRVLSEVPTQLDGDNGATIHDFTLGIDAHLDIQAILARAETIENAIAQVLNQKAENDIFNQLVIACQLDAREVDWLRAIYRYLRQSHTTFTIHTVVDALAGAPEVTVNLIALFCTQNDPSFKGERANAAAKSKDAIRAGLAKVQAINDDRLLRRYLAVIEAILRTNAFAPSGQNALAFKIDSSLVPGLPLPLPWREIFVYSRSVEGIHLRAGPVARGGIRWSDRRDDFRTEVLGLMKAQKVKNAVIVPTGAKGGFYPKRLPNPAIDRDAWFNEGRESYKLFIRTLLSITDNLRDDKVVHPEKVVIHDGDDPYFVVAADKGTATFSDTANAIAAEHDFWLGDAFASGGSIGYDHKAMGITARGAWISVQRHFLEMGVDVQKEPIRVIGCGDMSGDVFGNGMLLSKAIKLVAAFDHRHIFIDPDPDPAISWKERKRLFEMPRSNWAEYNEKLLSKGGGIFPRSAKKISLSAQARKALGIEEKQLDPEALISAILTSANDLLWFGGIGTYIKAADESHAEVGDPANDRLRVDAENLQVKAIGEGANLGATQAGRIEFSLNGGRINTDFIDNSAGVDCSDNEVNIKIALAAARASGRLSEERRRSILKDMTDEVAELVLDDNRLQALALSVAQQGGAHAIGAQTRLIEALEERGALDRETEGLGNNETLARRAGDGIGLTRPELAVLLSTTKLVLQDAIEVSQLPLDESADQLVLSDFPEALQAAFPKQILAHRLRSEIVGTVVANQIINRMGMIHPFELAEEEGVGLNVIAAAFVTCTRLLGLEPIWAKLEDAVMPENARLMLFDAIASVLRGHMADLLRMSDGEIKPAKTHARLQPLVQILIEQCESLLGKEKRTHIAAMQAEFIADGANSDLAQKVTKLFALDGAMGLAQLASASGTPPEELANGFSEIGALLGIDWAQSQASTLSPTDPWERLLVAGIARDFQQMRFDFLRSLGKGKTAKSHNRKQQIADWAADNELKIAQFRKVITRAHSAPQTSPAMLAQIAGQARSLLSL